MRMKILLVTVALLLAPATFAGTYSLTDWCFYVNSLDLNRSCNNGSGVDNFNPPVNPGTFDYVHLNDGNNGLGAAVMTLGPGTYNIFAIFNYDIGPGGGHDEYAATFGTLAVNQNYSQVYSIGTEGTATTQRGGDLYTQFASGTLDNQNHTSACSGASCPDVGVSLGYTNLVVPQGSTGTVTFVVSDTPPGSGFHVQQGDNNNPGTTVNLSSNVEISNDFSAAILSPAVPEPATTVLFAGGLSLMLVGLRLRRRRA